MRIWSRAKISNTNRITKKISCTIEGAIEATMTENVDVHGKGKLLHLSTIEFSEDFYKNFYIS